MFKAIRDIVNRHIPPGSDGAVCIKPSPNESLLVDRTGDTVSCTYSLDEDGHTITVQPGADTVIVENRDVVCHYRRDPNGRIAFSGVLAGPNIQPETIDEHKGWIESACLMCGQTLNEVAQNPGAIPHSSAYEEGLG